MPRREVEMETLEVNGDPPDLSGQTCDAFFVRQYWYEGELAEPANVTYLSFADVWHRLCFDCGIIFWRGQDGAPEVWEESEEYAWPLIDLAKDKQFKGEALEEYEMETIRGGSQVVFCFASGKRVVFRNVADRTEYAA